MLIRRVVKFMCKRNPFRGSKKVYFGKDRRGSNCLISVDEKELKNGCRQVVTTYHPHTWQNLKDAEKVVGKGKIKSWDSQPMRREYRK